MNGSKRTSSDSSKRFDRQRERILGDRAGNSQRNQQRRLAPPQNCATHPKATEIPAAGSLT